MWVRLRDMANLRAAQVKASKPKDFYASHWSDLSLAELEAFVGCRLSMEYAVVKRRLEQYFSAKSGFLFQSPGYRTVFTRIAFLQYGNFCMFAMRSLLKQTKLTNCTKYGLFSILLCPSSRITTAYNRTFPLMTV